MGGLTGSDMAGSSWGEWGDLSVATEGSLGPSGSESTGFKTGCRIDFEVEPSLVQNVGLLVMTCVGTRSTGE
jgi:hypothetical protein